MNINKNKKIIFASLLTLGTVGALVGVGKFYNTNIKEEAKFVTKGFYDVKKAEVNFDDNPGGSTKIGYLKSTDGTKVLVVTGYSQELLDYAEVKAEDEDLTPSFGYGIKVKDGAGDETYQPQNVYYTGISTKANAEATPKVWEAKDIFGASAEGYKLSVKEFTNLDVDTVYSLNSYLKLDEHVLESSSRDIHLNHVYTGGLTGINPRKIAYGVHKCDVCGDTWEGEALDPAAIAKAQDFEYKKSYYGMNAKAEGEALSHNTYKVDAGHTVRWEQTGEIKLPRIDYSVINYANFTFAVDHWNSDGLSITLGTDAAHTDNLATWADFKGSLFGNITVLYDGESKLTLTTKMDGKGAKSVEITDADIISGAKNVSVYMKTLNDTDAGIHRSFYLTDVELQASHTHNYVLDQTKIGYKYCACGAKIKVSASDIVVPQTADADIDYYGWNATFYGGKFFWQPHGTQDAGTKTAVVSLPKVDFRAFANVAFKFETTVSAGGTAPIKGTGFGYEEDCDILPLASYAGNLVFAASYDADEECIHVSVVRGETIKTFDIDNANIITGAIGLPLKLTATTWSQAALRAIVVDCEHDYQEAPGEKIGIAKSYCSKCGVMDPTSATNVITSVDAYSLKMNSFGMNADSDSKNVTGNVNSYYSVNGQGTLGVRWGSAVQQLYMPRVDYRCYKAVSFRLTNDSWNLAERTMSFGTSLSNVENLLTATQTKGNKYVDVKIIPEYDSDFDEWSLKVSLTAELGATAQYTESAASIINGTDNLIIYKSNSNGASFWLYSITLCTGTVHGYRRSQSDRIGSKVCPCGHKAPLSQSEVDELYDFSDIANWALPTAAEEYRKLGANPNCIVNGIFHYQAAQNTSKDCVMPRIDFTVFNSVTLKMTASNGGNNTYGFAALGDFYDGTAKAPYQFDITITYASNQLNIAGNIGGGVQNAVVTDANVINGNNGLVIKLADAGDYAQTAFRLLKIVVA